MSRFFICFIFSSFLFILPAVGTDGNGGDANGAMGPAIALGAAEVVMQLSDDEGVAGLIGFVTGGVLFKMGKTAAAANNHPTAEMYFLGAAQSVLQATSLFLSSRKNHKTACQIRGSSNCEEEAPCWHCPYGNKANKTIKDIRRTIRAAGYRISPDGSSITTPDGETYTSAELESELSKADQATLNNIRRKAFAKAKALSAKAKKMAAAKALKNREAGKSSHVASAMGGGSSYGYGGRRNARSRSKKNWDSYGWGNQYSSGGGRSLASESLKGLNKVVNGTSIGVEEDDIFELAHRSYVFQYQQNQFINSHTVMKKRNPF